MTVFLTEIRSGAITGFSCLIGLVLAVNPLASQEMINPNSDRSVLEKKSNTPVQLFPPVNNPVKPRKNLNKTKPDREVAVELKQLDLVDPESIGILASDNRGFEPNMWVGSSRKLIINLLGLLPKKMTSPGQRQLFRRLLLTRADPPVGAQMKKSLLSMRVAALYDAGDYITANQLIDAIPSDELREELSKIQTDILFRRQYPKKACGIVQSKGKDYNAIYWKKAEAYCLAIDGQKEKALLISEILSEQNDSVDPAFSTGIEALVGNKPNDLKRLYSLNGLLLSLLQSGKVTLPAKLPANLSIGDLASLALTEGRSFAKRVLEGESAMLGGAITPTQLAQIYKIKKPEKGELLRFIEDRETKWNEESRSFLFQAAVAEALPEKKARIIERALMLARLHKSFALTALMMSSEMDKIEPTAGLSWFAPLAARAYAISGDMMAVKKWLRLISKSSDVSVLPLSILSGTLEKGAISEKKLYRWYSSRKKEVQQGLEDQTRIFYSLMQAFNISVSGSLWSDVIDWKNTEKPLPVISGLLPLLSNAAQKGRVGETVALSIILLGEAGTQRSNHYAVVQAVRALLMVGQREAARQLALEAAVVAGL